MNLEDQLRDALRPEPATPEFRRRLMERIDRDASRSGVKTVPIRWRRRMPLAVAAALLAGAVIPVTVSNRERAERERRGVEARNELILALSVAHTKLRHTREMIHANTRRNPDE